MRAGVHGGVLALVIVLALLWVQRVGNPAALAVADVAALQQVPAEVLASTATLQTVVRALARVVAAGLIGAVPAVIGQVADLRVGHTLVVGALEFVKHAGTGPAGTDGHVVLVTCVRAVLDSVTHLILGDTLAIPTLELVHLFTCEVFTQLWTLIGSVAAVINLIAEVRVTHTQVVLALKLLRRTVPTVWVARLTVQLVRHVVAVFVPITLQLLLDAVTRGALESLRRTLPGLTLVLIGAISTIIIMVTAPPARNALVISTFEL
jgi:hypothetical protein